MALPIAAITLDQVARQENWSLIGNAIPSLWGLARNGRLMLGLAARTDRSLSSHWHPTWHKILYRQVCELAHSRTGLSSVGHRHRLRLVWYCRYNGGAVQRERG